MRIPDYLIYDEMQRREEQERDGGLVPLHLPLYSPELEERPSDEDDAGDEQDSNRGVIIIDMNGGMKM